MFTYNVKFLTCDDFVTLKSGDFKCYKYETKKKSEESVYDNGKRSFFERRGGHWTAVKPRQIRQLEANFRDRTAVFCDWLNENLIVIVFSSGAIAYLSVKPATLDVTQILFDRYVIGKLSGQSVTGVAFCKSHLLFTHTDRTATLITFGKSQLNQPCRIRDRDPHVQTVELGGSRRTERKISWCETSSGVRVLVWGATAVEPAPWSPVLEDHANVHLYQIKGQQMSLLAFHQLENETLCAEISSTNDNVVHVVEQIACHKSGVILEWFRYTAPLSELRALSLHSSPAERARCTLPAPARCVRRAPCGRRVLVACIDGSLHVMHAHAGLTHSARLGSVATDVRWAGAVLLAAEDGGRLQCYDGALTPLPHPAGCPQLSTLLREPRRMHLLATRSGHGGPLVLASFSGGPLALLGISHPELITAWIRSGRPSNAVSLLRSLDWELDGPQCLRATSALVSGAVRGGLTPDGEARAQAALGAYLAPRAPHSPNAQKYAPAVHDLARKFFHHLLRRGRIEKALSLCVDLSAWDLCVDARWAAARAGLTALADEAAALAATSVAWGLCVDARWAAARAGLTALADEAAALAATSVDSVCSDSCSQCSSSAASSPPASRPPPPPLPSLLPVAAVSAPASAAGIRPNLHQYLEKNDTIWNTAVEDRWPPDCRAADCRRQPTRDLIPRAGEAFHFRHLFQTELREDAPNATYRYNGYRPSPERAIKADGFERPKPEKNKVKFSDTVTIAVVASEGNACGSVARELADSLPLCAPHNYLAAFAPHPPPAAHTPPGTNDYVEV